MEKMYLSCGLKIRTNFILIQTQRGKYRADYHQDTYTYLDIFIFQTGIRYKLKEKN